MLLMPAQHFPRRLLLTIDFGVRFVGTACYTVFIAGVYSLSGNAFHVGLLGAMIVIPALVVSTGIGKVVGRFSARHTLNVLLVSRLLLFLIVVVTPPSLASLLVSAAVNSSLHQTSLVVKMSLDASLMTDDSRVEYLSTKGMQSSVVLTVAPAAGGFLFGLGGFAGALSVMACVIGLALVAVNLLEIPASTRQPGGVGNVADRPSARSSWAAVRAVPALHAALMLYCLVAVILETEAPLIFPFVDEKLAQGPMLAGILLGVSGLGGVAGAAATRIFPRMLVPSTIKWLILADGIVFLLFTLTSNVIVSISLFAALGAMGAITLVIVESAVQREVDSKDRPFVFSLMQFSAGAGGATVGILAAFIASRVGTPPVLAACALLEILAAVFLIGRAVVPVRRAEARP
ncbi:hypothetical protein CH275_28425 [Rhodococcus sp. 06-235-1A]|nr:hypothetical protein CH275_28425 [Rhodococcus sp. 06-235-1A]